MENDDVKSLEQHLKALVETSRELGIASSNFPEQNALNNKFKALTNCLKNLNMMKDKFREVKLPVSVFDYIDEGKNPALYTKDCLMKTLKKNEEVKGKIVTFKTFRDLLLEEMNKNFPEEYEAYMALTKK